MSVVCATSSAMTISPSRKVPRGRISAPRISSGNHFGGMNKVRAIRILRARKTAQSDSEELVSYALSLEDSPSADDLKAIERGLDDYNSAFAPGWEPCAPIHPAAGRVTRRDRGARGHNVLGLASYRR